MAANGTLTNVDNVGNNAALELDGASALTTAVISGETYLFVAGQNDDGFSAFRVAANGTLVNVASVADDATLKLNRPVKVTTAVIGATTYLFVAGIDDDGVSVFSAVDPPTIISDGAGEVATVAVAENTNAVTAVTASYPVAGALLFAIVGGNDAARFVIDATTGALAFITAANFEVPGDADGNNSYIVQVRASAGGFFDDQTITVTVTNVSPLIVGTNAGNVLNGTAEEDIILGLGSNDLLRGVGSNDRLEGGTGNDTLDGGLGNDRMIGGAGNDTYVVNSAADVLVEFSGIDTVRSTVSKTLAAGFEKLTLLGALHLTALATRPPTSSPATLATTSSLGLPAATRSTAAPATMS